MDHSKSSLLRLLATNAAIGAAAAVVMLGGLLMLDTGGLRHLIVADHSPLVPLLMLGMGLAFTFGAAAISTAVMALGREHVGRNPREGELIPLRATSRRRSARS